MHDAFIEKKSALNAFPCHCLLWTIISFIKRDGATMREIRLSKADVSYWRQTRQRQDGALAYGHFETQSAVRILEELLLGEDRSELLEVVKQLQRARKTIFKALPKEEKVAHGAAAPSIKSSPEMQRLNSAHMLPRAPILSEEKGGAAPPPIYAENADARRPAMAGGDVDNVIEVMRRNPDNELIQVKGCIALLDHMALVRRSDSTTVVPTHDGNVWICGTCSHRNEIAKQKVAYTLLELASSGERCFLCTALPTMGTKEAVPDKAAIPNKIQSTPYERIFTLGGVEILTDALRKHPKCLGLQRNACFSLARLAARDNRIVPAFIARGGLPLLMRAMEVFFDEPEIQAQCMGILGCPEIVSDDVARIDCKHAAEVVLSVARAYGAHKRLMSLCCLAIANLALKDEQNVELLCRAGAPHIIINCLKRNMDNMNALKSGVWTLLTLTRFLESGYHVEARLCVRKEGGVHLAARALDEIEMKEDDAANKLRENLTLLMSYLGAEYDSDDKEDAPTMCAAS